MEKLNIPLLSTICKTAAPPSFEQRLRQFVELEVTDLVDDCFTDALGNLYAVRKGTAEGPKKKIMVAAHLDEIGFIVTHIEEGGFLRFHTLGGFDPKTLSSQRVIVHGKKDIVGVMGSKPIHLMSVAERGKSLSIKDYFIDTGMSKEELEKYVSVGDPISRERELIEMGDCVNSKSLDNRLAVFILLECLRELKDEQLDYDVYGVFTVQEEVGLRGARVAAHNINPDFGLGLDITIAFDVPGAQAHEKITALGAGTAIKIMDGSSICDYRMVQFMKETADAAEIPWQPEILTGGGSDTGGLQLYGKSGAITGAISIPCRHVHQTVEMAHKEDIYQSIQLLKQCLLNISKYDWSFR